MTLISMPGPRQVRPLALRRALVRLGRSVAGTAWSLARGRVHQPGTSLGRQLRFVDGTSARVYRETVVARGPLRAPAVLLVEFRMRFLRGGLGQSYFRRVSVLNTPLFAGFPGFATKLWLTADEEGRYRGLYEWDDAGAAEAYVRALWWPLALISDRGSIRYAVLPGRTRGAVLGAASPP